MSVLFQDDTRGDEIQGFRAEDDATIDAYQGISYRALKNAIWENPYQDLWGDAYQRPLPSHRVSLIDVLRSHFTRAAARTLDSLSDLRWGRKRRGFRRLIHPNGVCLAGTWKIDADNPYSGFFRKGSDGLVIARISSNSTATTRDRMKSFSLVGKVFPTHDENDETQHKPANFFTQDDFGGTPALRVTDVEYRNAPNVTAWNRGPELPILIQTGRVLKMVDREELIRQVYSIAELDPQPDEPTNTPEFMRLTPSPGHLVIDEHDFRDEVMAHIFDRGDPGPKREFRFDISVSNTGRRQGNLLSFRGQRHDITRWQRIGVLAFHDAVVSYNGDFVVHFHHPPWRTDRNDPDSAARQGNLVSRSL